MINYNPKSWITLIFTLHKSDTLRMLWKELLFMGSFTLLIAYIIREHFSDVVFLKELSSVYSIIGFVISLLLVFRTNTAYDRWWEGRRKWGELVNDTRNFAIKVKATIPTQEHEYFKRMVGNFPFAMKEHLRKGIQWEELELEEEERKTLEQEAHVPLAIASALYNRINELRLAGKISEETVLMLDRNLNAFMDACGACERIKNTPIPFSYSLFLKKFIFIYVLTLPLTFVSTFGYFAAIIATLVFYVLVSIEILAEEIEDPFGPDDNDLPTDELAMKIKATVSQQLS